MRILFFSLLFIFFSGNSFGQDKKAQDAARRLQQQNQRLASEKAQLERERGQLTEKLVDQEKQSKKSLQDARAKHSRELAKLKEADDQKLAEAAAREEELKSKLTASEQALSESRRDGEQLRKRLANQQETIGFWQARTGACGARSDELSKIGNELLERYRTKSCSQIGLDNESLTGIGRAHMENVVDGYRERLRKASMEPKEEVKKQEPVKQQEAEVKK
jgi:hypothetical protein